MDEVERHVAELAEQLIAWSLDHQAPEHALMSVDVPPMLLDPGDTFVMRAHRRDGTIVLLACRVQHRLPWRRHTNLIKFDVLDPVHQPR